MNLEFENCFSSCAQSFCCRVVTIADLLYESEEFDNRLMVNILEHLVKLKFDDIR